MTNPLNLDQLEALARAAQQATEENANSTRPLSSAAQDVIARFGYEANPTTVLALVSRIREQQQALDQALAANAELREALERIADPRKRGHREPDAYTELGCVMNIASEALAQPHPGARILERMQALEKVAEAAREMRDYTGDGNNGPPRWIIDCWEKLDEALAQLDAESEGGADGT